MNIYAELRRRNVFKVAIVYAAVAWLLLQVSDTLGPALRLPEWFVSAVAFLLILGFPIAIIFAWAFELTPDGLKAEMKADPAAAISGKNGNRLNYAIAGALLLALGYFAFEKSGIVSERGKAQVSTAAQDALAETDNSIAVLPFVNMSSDEEQEYFSDGLSEELLNLLARIPRTSLPGLRASGRGRGNFSKIVSS